MLRRGCGGRARARSRTTIRRRLRRGGRRRRRRNEENTGGDRRGLGTGRRGGTRNALAQSKDDSATEAVRVILQHGHASMLEKSLKSADQGQVFTLIKLLGNVADRPASKLAAKVITDAKYDTAVRQAAVRAVAASR